MRRLSQFKESDSPHSRLRDEPYMDKIRGSRVALHNGRSVDRSALVNGGYATLSLNPETVPM